MTGPGALESMGWLLDSFAQQLNGIAHVIVVSSDGLLLAATGGLPPERAEQLASVTAGLVSLTYGTARHFEGGNVQQTIVHMEAGYLILMSISDGSLLCVHGSPDSDMSVFAYHLALFLGRAGHVMTPQLRSELRQSIEDSSIASTK